MLGSSPLLFAIVGTCILLYYVIVILVVNGTDDFIMAVESALLRRLAAGSTCGPAYFSMAVESALLRRHATGSTCGSLILHLYLLMSACIISTCLGAFR